MFRLARHSTPLRLLFDAHPIDTVSTTSKRFSWPSRPPDSTLSTPDSPSLPEPIPSSIFLCSSLLLILFFFPLAIFPISSTRCMRRSARNIRRGCALTTVNPFLLTSFIRVLSSRLCFCISLIIRSVIIVLLHFSNGWRGTTLFRWTLSTRVLEFVW